MSANLESGQTKRTDGRSIHQTFCYAGLMLALFMLSGVSTFRYTIHYVERLTASSDSPTKVSNCSYPFVYNKPHKTASTRIQMDIFKWAASVDRHAYKCSTFINQATMQMRECIPEDSSGCAIVATHIVLSPVMRQIIRNKIGNFRLITSTRDPSARMVSSYLQQNRKKAGDDIDMQHLKDYVKSQNPWKLYNYHTGSNRRGTCPVKGDEKLLLPDLVNQADIVIDADLREVSNAILESHGLFKISASKANVRSSGDVMLDEEAKSLIRNTTCVEEEIHKMYRLRMASLYEKATGKPCLSNKRDPTACF